MKNLKKKIIITIFGFVFLFGTIGMIKAATFVDLLTANSFAILAGSGITNTGATTIVGDVGSFPTLTQIGFGSVILTGTNHLGDAVTQTAKADLITAYNDAANQPLSTAIIADLGGQTLAAGVYNTASSIAITGTVTLNGGPSDVWIFQAGSTLTTSSGSTSHVSLAGGAQACNVFWQVGSSATLGTGSDFSGNIIAMDSITDDGGSTISGRLLARNAAITLNNTNVTRSACSGATQGTLHVIKHVINNNGGNVLASASTITVSGTTNISPNSFAGNELGTTILLDAGSYSVNEGANIGYARTLSADCSGTITSGGDKTCTITDDDIAPTLVINKVIVNDNNGTKLLPSDFSLKLDGLAVTHGIVNTTTIGLHTVSEIADSEYISTIGGDCAINGTITLNIGDTKTCSITNNDIVPVVAPVVVSHGSSGGYYLKPVVVSISPTITTTTVTTSVLIPKLPKTGFPPEEKSISWYSLIFSKFFNIFIQ